MLKDRQELRAFREECVRAYNAYKRKIPVSYTHLTLPTT